jgi:NAD(P)-dependent dehydrogenase (short-subunit alcohol dehydrogenase family)
MKKVCIVTGAASGLGFHLVNRLRSSHNDFDLIIPTDLSYQSENGTNLYLDVRSEGSWISLCQLCHERGWTVSGLINCAGINGINFLENVTLDDWHNIMGTNAMSIFLGARTFLDDLTANQGVILNITSNASHMPMTSSLVYNASKAAAHIMTLQLARELSKKNGITVFGVAPNKMEGTQMSQYIEKAVPEVRGWTPDQARAYQDASLLAGETPPELVAEFIASLLAFKDAHQHLTGCILPYGA